MVIALNDFNLKIKMKRTTRIRYIRLFIACYLSIAYALFLSILPLIIDCILGAVTYFSSDNSDFIDSINFHWFIYMKFSGIGFLIGLIIWFLDYRKLPIYDCPTIPIQKIK